MRAADVISKSARELFQRDMVKELLDAGIVTDRLGRQIHTLSYEEVRYLLVLKRATAQ